MKMKPIAIRTLLLAALVLAGSNTMHAQDNAARTQAPSAMQAQPAAQAENPAGRHSTLRPGLRTNLLAWACSSASLGIDLRWGTRWQAGIDGSIALKSAPADGWQSAPRFAVSGAGAEVRRYFNALYRSVDTRRLSGNGDNNGGGSGNGGNGLSHHGPYLALNVRYLKFDFLRNEHATGREGTLLTAGITLGYTFCLTRHLTLDAALGAGYIHQDYNRYQWYAPAARNRFISHQNGNTLGLTQAEVSVAYGF